MKKNIFISTLLLALSVSTFGAAVLTSNKTVEANASASLPTSFDLNDTSESDIRSYYSGLDSKSSTQLIGTNLLINLKTILSANNTFMAYGSYKAGVGAAYKITDRNWDASPASDISGYNASTNKITGYNLTDTDDNPYIINLYVSRDTSVTGNQITNPIYHHTGTSPNFDKEHVFPKSYGFLPSENAGTDMHHLIAADPDVNQHIHNNYPYGYVSTVSDTGDDDATAANKLGTPKTSTGTYSPTVSAQSACENMIEVADEWKGDVARALLYMVARYNYLSGSGTPTQAEPNLSLVPYAAYTKSTLSCADYSASQPIEYGNVKDLIAWHHADPVDNYEMHRNNLIYTNFQNNRNPFIDYPDWVDYIWDSNGNYVTSATNGYAKPASDSIYEYNDDSAAEVKLDKSSLSLVKGNTGTLTATANGSVTWTSSNANVVTVSASGTNNVNATLTAKAAGTAIVVAKNDDATATCTVTVTDSTVSVTGVTLDKTTLSLEAGSSDTLTATVSPSDASDTSVTWSSSNSAIATVSNGKVTAVAAGTATITVTTTDGSKTATCAVTVTAKPSEDTDTDWPYVNDVAYRMYLVNTSSTKAGTYYFTGTMNSYYGATSTTQSSGVSMYFEDTTDGHYLYFLSGSTKEYIYVVASGTHINFTYSDTNKSVFTYNQTISSITTVVSDTEYGLGSYSTNTTFGTGKTSYTTNYFAQFELVNSNTAYTFADNFLEDLVCDNGVTPPSTSVWSDLSSEYSSLETGWKNMIVSAVADESGTDIEQAVAKYDYIISKYGTSAYDNFINRSIKSASRSFFANSSGDNNNLTVILAIVSVTSLLGAALLLKKTKQD